MPVKKVGGWQQQTVTEVYNNPWIRLTHEEVITPAGTEGIYGVVHFKNRAVAIVPIDNEGYTWLVKQSRYTLNDYTWEIPAGGAPMQEDPLEAAKRELAEETGLRGGDWKELMRLHTSNSVTDECAITYVARQLTYGASHLEDTEDIEVKRLPLREAIAMAAAGDITDALSVAALLKLALNTTDFVG